MAPPPDAPSPARVRQCFFAWPGMRYASATRITARELTLNPVSLAAPAQPTVGGLAAVPPLWCMVYQIPVHRRSCASEYDVADTHLKIAPIGEGLSLKARAYDALKMAILNMNIYAEGAQLRLDERDLSQRFGVSRTPLREALAQ